MKTTFSAGKKKVVRKHILQQASDLYLHPLADRTVVANLKNRFPALALEHVRELSGYLEQKELIVLRKSRSGLSLQITAKGIDVLDGAVKVRGVEPACTRFTRLEYKKDIRRGILSYCYSFQEFFNEDTEILEDFRESGFSNLLLEEIRFHIWYLSQKTLLDLKTYSLGGDQVFMARITAKGIDTAENGASEPGVSENDG